MGKSSKNSKKKAAAPQRDRDESSRSSSSGNASSSAPRSERSRHHASRHDGASSPPPTSSRPTSPREASATSPKSPSQGGAPIVAPARPYNFDLGGGVWSGQVKLPARPKAPSKLGQDAKIALNTYKVNTYSTKKVYQYEVMIGNGVEKRGVIKAVWSAPQIKKDLGPNVIFDGDRLAWGLVDLKKELRHIIDLDQLKGRTPRAGNRDEHRVAIRQTTEIRFDVLDAFLKGKTSFDRRCLEAINCLDHVLREWPSTRLHALRRSFYTQGGQRFNLGSGLEAAKGAYQSLRTVLGPTGPCLSINVDVSNGVFWKPIPMVTLCVEITGCRDPNDLARALRAQGPNGRIAKDLKRLQKKRVLATHRGSGKTDEYSIDKFDFRGARNTTFPKTDPKTGQETQTSVYDYFAQQYNRKLQWPDLPVVKTPKKYCYVPLELLTMAQNQVCKLKLDERQTSEMIKFAVTPPEERFRNIQNALATLNWAADPVMKAYGLSVSTERTVVPARVLPAPKVVFGAGGTAAPGTSGRWDLKGKKFLTSNTAPLKAWGVMVIPGTRGGKPDKSTIENFVNAFVRAYEGHGGRVETRNPVMALAEGNDPSNWVTSLWNQTGQKHNSRPQMLMFILPDKNSMTYQRIKRSADCRYGVVSQCVQFSHAQKAAPQYLSNVLMKFNAKLGGTTCRAVGPKSAGATGLFTVPTVIVGADVSHAAPGSSNPSIAAITCSTDKLGVQYAAAVETNGYRAEMISQANIDTHLKPLLQHWCTTVNNGKMPKRLIYIRDGVSEGQYAHVLQQEVRYMKDLLKQGGATDLEFVVMIAQKRHNIRFFPERGDKNKNALPGTLVESGATHPFENDFYLCAHAAIKGTARPVHYQVILNEANMSNDEIYTLLYEHSYQYLRATTPVSIHPAVYYAHIASNRGTCHDKNFNSEPMDDSSDSKESKKRDVDETAEPLLGMNDPAIRLIPWFI